MPKSPEGGGRSWGAPARGLPSSRGGYSYSDGFPERQNLFGDPYSYELLKRSLAGPPVPLPEHHQRDVEIRAEVDAWFPHYRRAAALLPHGWDILWKVGVPEGEPFRAHLIDDHNSRRKFTGTSHAAVFDAIREYLERFPR